MIIRCSVLLSVMSACFNHELLSYFVKDMSKDTLENYTMNLHFMLNKDWKIV